ncbi:MAG: extracellular solute-binding protein [Alphaproteobacteria bacterium]|nr:extracellular solute-binding protein [Alphaproteobacteria bacterium]MDX5415358.1 extracellular solute-binding protein [Alphaproteobacteria bacterium]MDX5492573.1 extracellular solute-binding protein [Alphaproteobacteria bacterium]
MTRPVLGAAALAVIAVAAIFHFMSGPSSAPEGELEGASAAQEGAGAAERPTEIVASDPFLSPDFDPEAPRHGSSLFGELKYGPDFAHFDYVNPDAPKGGLLRYGVIGSFDSLNLFIVKGQKAAGLGLIYDTLMARSLDEPTSEYGLLAESVRHPADYSSVTYVLREGARFHDGEPVTPEDVIWTLETLKKNDPFFGAYYANVASAEQTGAREVTFRFDEKGNRELPQIVGQMPVLPKHYWQGKDARGRERNFAETTLEPPLGSGAYRVGAVATGHSITFERVEDYWAKDLPVTIGQNNFDRIRFEYYRDGTVALEALKGNRLDFRIENSARNWATGYEIAAVRRGDLKKEEIPSLNPQGMQGFAFNIRREKFQDPRVREAFNWAFDFEWMNRTLFYEQYTRSYSYFSNSDLAATGLPEGRELEILEAFRDRLPAEVFTQEFRNPVTDGSGNNRANLRRAAQLLDEAGWTVKDGKRVNEKGEAFNVEFLLAEPTFERIIGPYRQALERLGIESSIRVVDTAQYQNREDNRDFDIVVQTFGQSVSPGNEQRDYWSCAAAERPGSRNVIGICDPAIDALIERIIFADSRADLVAATKALDRVLLAGHYVVPQWYAGVTRAAYWSRLKHPETMPAYNIGFPTIWWMDESAPQAEESE